MKVVGAWFVVFGLTRWIGVASGVNSGTATIVASAISFLGSVMVALIETYFNRKDRREDAQVKLRKENQQLKKALAAERKHPHVSRS